MGVSDDFTQLIVHIKDTTCMFIGDQSCGLWAVVSTHDGGCCPKVFDVGCSPHSLITSLVETPTLLTIDKQCLVINDTSQNSGALATQTASNRRYRLYRWAKPYL